MGVDKEKISVFVYNMPLFSEVISNSIKYEESDLRVNWLKNAAQYINDSHINGSVAECGVNRGDFAYYINLFFENRVCYLFDTFEGFNEFDIVKERELNNDAFIKSSFNKTGGFLTGEDIVRNKMPNKNAIIIKKGLFPSTAKGINDQFAFVNLDMDLYTPTLAALHFFYERMAEGGVILCHDFFSHDFPGIKQSFIDFEKAIGRSVPKISIGDYCSMAIIKS